MATSTGLKLTAKGEHDEAPNPPAPSPSEPPFPAFASRSTALAKPRDDDCKLRRLRPWAERARQELRASGERLRRREVHDTEELTPQELQIALQVAEGKTNKEVGAALFLSHKIVEFHLSRIYRKLDINSRTELIRRFASEAAATVPS